MATAASVALDLDAKTNELPYRQLEREVVEWCDSVYEEADTELMQQHETKLTARIIDFIEGKQWSMRSRSGRSKPVINRTVNKFIEMVGLLTDLELDFKVKFNDKIDGYSELEKLFQRMIPDWADSRDVDFEQELAQVVMFGLIHTGFVKIQWNPALAGGMGDVEFQPISPLNFMMIGTSDKLQNAEVCIARRVVTMPWLIRRYGDVAKQVQPDARFSDFSGEVIKPARFTKSSWAGLSKPLQNLLGTKQEAVRSKFPRVMLKEFWLKDDKVWNGKESIVVGNPLCNWSYIVEPGMKLYPRGRLIIVAGDKVLEDTCNPYWHGRFPFSMYRAFRVPWKLHGMSPMEPIVAMQMILNRVYSGVMDTVAVAVERPLVAPKAALSQGDWDNISPNDPGAKIAYNNNAPREPKFLDPPTLPQYVDGFTTKVEREQDMSSGASAIQQSLNKKQMPSGDTLDTILSARSINVRFMSRGLKSFLQDAGSLVAADMMQFYTAAHRVSMYGADGLVPQDTVPFYGHMLPHGMKPEEFVKKASFTIRRGSLLAIEKTEDLPLAMALRKQGDLSRKNLFRFLDRNIDIAQNERELKEEAAEKLALMAAAQGATGKGHKK